MTAPAPLQVKYNQADIAPFWDKLPFLFAFPLRPGPLVFLAIIVGASFIAGAVLGGFGLLFKGALVYLGLRYGFNVLDLFAKGRFEGESVDKTLWGAGETRPAKLGLVIVLYAALALTLGNAIVGSRLQRDTRAQEVLVERWKQEHAAERARWQRDYQALSKRHGLDSTAKMPAPAAPAAQAPAEPESEPEDVAEAAATLAEPPIDRAAIVQAWRAEPGDALWWRLLPAWYWALMIALSLFLPSAVMVIALEDAFFKALNPAFLLQFLRAMGGAYFVLWLFLLAIVGARQIVLAAGANWPAFLRFPVEMALGTYLGLVLCALIGYVLYQFHQALHLDVEVDFDTHRQVGGAEGIARVGNTSAAIHQAQPQDPRERKVQALLAQGKVREAIDEVKDEMRYDRLDPDLNDKLHDLYKRLGDRDATLSHGQQWLSALTRAGRGRQALAALQSLQRIDTGFSIVEGGALVTVAQAAMEHGERELAGRLIDGFERRFPQHKELPRVQFLAARLASEQSRQHEQAAAMLRALLRQHPQHAIAAEVRQYLAVLLRLPPSR